MNLRLAVGLSAAALLMAQQGALADDPSLPMDGRDKPVPAVAWENRIGRWQSGWSIGGQPSSADNPPDLQRGTQVAALEVTSVSVESQGSQRPGGWNAGDKVVIKGRGFTPHENKIFCTDGQAEDFLLIATSSDGSEIVFVLPDGFYAPHGTGLMVKNANGVASTIPRGERRTF